jgi:hypothetical protein
MNRIARLLPLVAPSEPSSPLRLWAYLLIFTAATLAATTQTQSAVTYRTVAVSGQQAPGVPDGAVFAGSSPAFFNQALINNAGQVSFTAILQEGAGGVTSDNRSGVWSGDVDGLSLVARSSDQAPNALDGALFAAFSTLRFNDAGQTAFIAILAADSGGVDIYNNEGIWSEGSGTLSMVARSGAPAPGTSTGVVFDRFSSLIPFALNEAGQVAFRTNLRPFQAGGVTFDNWQGLWSNSSGSLELLARQGDQALGLPNGVTFEEIRSFRLNDAGQVLLNNEFDGAGIQPSDYGTWLLGPGTPGLVSLRSDPVPGEPATTTYWRRISGFDDSDQLYQIAIVQREVGGISQIDGSLWLVQTGGLTPLVQNGAPAPGLPPGTVFQNDANSIEQFTFNNENLVAFEARFSPSTTLGSNKAIWAGDPSDLSLVVLGADPPPGTPDNTLFLSFDNLTLNALGQVAFTAQLAIVFGGVSSDNDRGVWATDLLGQLHLIAREGDLFEVASGDMRLIDGVGIGSSQSFNDSGTLLLSLSFSDGTSGIFTAIVPEPGTFTVIMLVSPALLRRRSVFHV